MTNNVVGLDSRPHEAKYHQMAQYTCTFDARHGTVHCQPFVRTFVEAAGGKFQEITSLVNQKGERLPRATMADGEPS
ncbi:BZ3500_MvSof-1268-A1-R1_Chr4-2g07035 [Microbotryum saponariae]|uniref:BZ3500_MvSof-1268-A1-R1_Chr4-2g07035 protein n=1 Tax=Microbotryum saponariae TaxID=289078 RepID=A0A2X0KSU7_9BASI|nr:BZ3500_MvSof-1268-A1-R1_Chr4-2g07035 [Microbotryum saponariae]SDA06700.1 BZ3501_MvSof-1269-A2-R1_Chr4-2g06746 [Microbotryum saponariae]